MNGMLTAVACARLTDLINRILRYGPVARQTLAAEAGKTVQIQCDLSPLPISPPPLTLYFTRDGVELLPRGGDATARVRGSVPALVELVAASDSDDWPPAVDIDGDRALVDTLRHQLRVLAIDWEGALADLIGDVPAHLLGESVRGAQRWQGDASGRATAGVANFVREEAPHAAGVRVLTALANQVANRVSALRAGLDDAATESR